MRVNPRVANAAREPGTASEAASPRPRRAFPGYLREAADPDGGCGAVPDPHGGHGDAIRSRRGRQGRWWVGRELAVVVAQVARGKHSPRIAGSPSGFRRETSLGVSKQ